MSPAPLEPGGRSASPAPLEPGGAGVPARHCDARLKIIASLLFVAALVAIQPGWPLPFDIGGFPIDLTWTLLALAWSVLFAIVLAARLPMGPFVRRVLTAAPLVLLLVSPVVLGRGWAAGSGPAAVMATRSLAALAAMGLLADTTPFPHILNALSRMRVPSLLIAVPAFMVRYISVLQDEMERMRRARAARTFRQGRWADWTAKARLIAVLFVRAFERAERVHSAMCARGFDGTMRRLDR